LQAALVAQDIGLGVRVFFWSAVLSGTADLYDGWSVRLILVVVLLIVVGMPRGWFI